MDVYKLRDDLRGDYRSLIMAVGDPTEFNRRFDGTPMKRPWTDVTIEWTDDQSQFPKPDFPQLSSTSIPIFSSRAIDALRDLLERNGEILPTTCGGDQLFFFNVTRVIDAFDESNSEVIRYRATSEIARVARYFFLEERLAGAVIFKIPQFPVSRVFVTDPFVERVRSTGLTGFWFPRLWSPDPKALLEYG